MLIIADHAGFCFGVKRALELAERSAPAYTFGPIIHNPQVVDGLRNKGVIPVDSADIIPPSSRVIIRAHGIPRAEYESLDRKNLSVIDATCPFVARIHRMVSETDRTVIVVGKHEHPEVKGILGWVKTDGYSVSSAEEALALPRMERVLAVSQTTISEELFDSVIEAVKTRADDLAIEKTICTATREHQKEAVEIAAKSDMMIVVGGKNSSNTQKLYEMCKRICPDTLHIETVDEIKGLVPPKGAVIGLTAGASTPDCIFKEVVTHMNDIENKDQVIVEETQEPVGTPAESDFMADVEKTLVQIRPGQTITGKVVMITEDEVGVDIGYKADGLVQKSDLSVTDVKIGDELEVEVVKLNDGEGNVVLSQKNIINRKVWDEIVAKSESGEFVHAIGKEAVKGGLLAAVNDIRAFIPASQLSNRYVEKIEDFVGQEMDLKIIEVDKAKKRIVASRKAVMVAEAAAKRKQLWDTIEEGSVVKGTVRRLADFGAFVDIGGIDGLVHVAELSWGRVKHPSEVVSVGDEIEVKITRVDPEKERISLSMKALSPRPWSVATDKYPVGAIVEGKVVRITTFGAFVELEPGLDGLVHISQCAPARIEKVEDAVNVGDAVRVKVLDVNPEAKRISLSIRQAMEDEALETAEATENYDIDNVQE